MLFAALLLAAAPPGQPARTLSAEAAPTAFDRAYEDFNACLTITTRMGMMTKMAPPAFADTLAGSCLDQQGRFRTAAIAEEVAGGMAAAEAVSVIDGRIANARAIYAADQAKFIATRRVPR